jgi:Phage T7 tail fibre protein
MAMLVNPVEPRVEYTATALQTLFTVPFEWLDDDDINIYVEGILVESDDYTLTGAGVTGGGSVTFDTGVALGNTVVILRNTIIQRLTDFPVSGRFDIEQLNEELDNIFLILQELREFDGRVLALDNTEAEADAGWDAGGRRIINVGDPTDSKDAANKDYVDIFGGGSGSGSGSGSSDGYTISQIDYLLENLETDLTALIASTVTALVESTVTSELSTSYRIREIYKYTGSDTFVTPAWCRAVRLIGQAGGGGGGYADGEGADYIAAANGGGGGAFVVTDLIDVSSVASIAVVIGAGGLGGRYSTLSRGTQGGTTSFTGTGISVTAGGGTGGSGSGGWSEASGVDTRAEGSTGVGGSAVTGELYSIPGHDGERGLVFTSNGNGFGGAGGNSFFGKGGYHRATEGAGTGGVGYGAGGGGAVSVGTSNYNGGAGTAGVGFIECYE